MCVDVCAWMCADLCGCVWMYVCTYVRSHPRECVHVTLSLPPHIALITLATAAASRYIRQMKPQHGFALFESESLMWPGFVEFDDVNGKVLTYSSSNRCV